MTKINQIGYNCDRARIDLQDFKTLKMCLVARVLGGKGKENLGGTLGGIWITSSTASSIIFLPNFTSITFYQQSHQQALSKTLPISYLEKNIIDKNNVPAWILFSMFRCLYKEETQHWIKLDQSSAWLICDICPVT